MICRQQDGFSGQRALVLPLQIIQDCKREPLYAALYITDIGYYPDARNHFRERTESIPQYVFIYCVEGRGWFSIQGKTCKVVKNQFFILPAGVPHAYGADEDEPWTIYWIHYSGSLAQAYSANLYEPKDIPPHVNSRISERIALFEEIFRILGMGYSKENLLYSSSVFHCFLGSLRFIRQYRQQQHTEIAQLDVIDAAIHFIKENIEKKITISELAHHVGYSPSHFVALFCARVGYSPIAYFNQLKIQRACQLLDLTDMKVNQVCYKVGIKDCYYFSRLFRKEMGISPSAYKRLKKG